LFCPGSGRLVGDEREANRSLTVEIRWATDETFPVDRMMLISADRADEAKDWQDVHFDFVADIPGLEEADLVESRKRRRRVVILTPAECETLYGALQKQPASDRKSHYGYDAMIRLNGTIAWRKLGTRAETCKFLRELSARFEPSTAQAIARFTNSVDRLPGGAQGAVQLPGSFSIVPAPAR
jgi:hypothetical protein